MELDRDEFMINIVCLKWGTKYGPEYVNRLFFAIQRHTTIPFTLHCFTDDSTNINSNVTIHPLPYKNLDGWWNKLYLFSKDVSISGRIFFIDLDTLIVGNIDDILQHDKGFVVLRDFFTGHARTVIGTDNVGSGLMSFDGGKHTYIWDEFMKNPQGVVRSLHPHGDQKWIQQKQVERVYWQDIFPEQVVSYKVHCRDGLPSNARIICYHGKPSIPESISQRTKAQWWTIEPAPWVAEHWKDETS